MIVNNLEPKQFARTLEGVIEFCTNDILEQFRLALDKKEDNQRSPLDDLPFSTLAKALLQYVQKKLAEHYLKEGNSPATEAVLAELKPLLDRHRPEIEAEARTLHQNLCQEVLQWQARVKAQEIARKTVETLLAGVLPGLDLGCFFSVSGDTVHLNLKKTLTASIDLPLRELSEFLSDPARIESALKAAPPAGIKESSPPSRQWSPVPSNFIY